MYRISKTLVPISCILQPSQGNRLTFLYPLLEPTRILDIYVKESSTLYKDDYVLTFDTFPRSYTSYGLYLLSFDQMSIIETIHVRKGESISFGHPLYTIKLSTL